MQMAAKLGVMRRTARSPMVSAGFSIPEMRHRGRDHECEDQAMRRGHRQQARATRVVGGDDRPAAHEHQGKGAHEFSGEYGLKVTLLHLHEAPEWRSRENVTQSARFITSAALMPRSRTSWRAPHRRARARPVDGT